MVIDFHTHVFPEKIASKTIALLAQKSGAVPHTDGTVSGLIENLEKGGADIAITLPVVTAPHQFESINRFALTINRQTPKGSGQLISFGGIHPACEDIEGKMRFLKENGFLGVKIHPDYQDTFVNDEGYIRILRASKELDMIVVTHAGVDDGYTDKPVRCPPELALEVIQKVGHSKFVLAHMGGNRYLEGVYTLLAGQDVYFDTSFVLPDIGQANFKKMLEKHGEDRILFATDCPWRDIGEEIARVRSYGLNKETEEKILWRNAAELLGISRSNL